jgi:beta-lysine 5,6-aminomutase alpha subunit
VTIVAITLDIDDGVVASCSRAAKTVAAEVTAHLRDKTTVSVERTVARLLGIDGVGDDEVPVPNLLVDQIRQRDGLAKGFAYWMGNALVYTGRSPTEIAREAIAGRLDWLGLPAAPLAEIRATITAECARTLREINERRRERTRFRRTLTGNPEPLIYVLTATGNVYEDVVHSRAVADNGGDIVAVIRSTAQSLFDYVPYGPTTEGYGGTFATQANFRIMREAMDDWSRENGRYIRLSSFCSGLCMPEIAAMGAVEGLDNMVNDALYGILYRNINMLRTLVDQRVSRLINGYFGIVINTGEDNYLRTADAITAAPSVIASQFINYYLARESGVPDRQIGLGGAFEISPLTPDSLLLELAQAQLTRQLFPNCPVKFMPPTKHMDGNLFRTHAVDTLFNLVTILTGQGIQTLGVPTEGVFTPHIQDRVLGLENARYVFNAARSLRDEISFRPDGIVQNRASDVLAKADELLGEIARIGLFKAVENGTFGNVSRSLGEGRGADGIVTVDADYLNPYLTLMESGSMEGRDDA